MKDLEIFKKQLDIMRLEEHCKTLEQVECPITHEFCPGLYTRIMHIPADTFIIGKRHRHKTLNIMTKGKALVYAGENMPVTEINAPFTFVSDPMVKKMALFTEESEWINVHPTEETDIKKIEKEFIITEKEYLISFDREAIT